MNPSPPEQDLVDNLLAPSADGDTTSLRARLLDQTNRALRYRRLWRRFGTVSALVGTYLAGLLTMYLMSNVMPRRADDATQGVRPSGDHSRQIEPAIPLPSAREREWDAVESTERQVEKYSQAGDAYLTQQVDPSNALRCYTAALDRGGSTSLEINTDDSWLMMKIKQARLKEMNDAKNDR